MLSDLRRSDQPGPADAGRALHDRLVQLLPARRARVRSVPVCAQSDGDVQAGRIISREIETSPRDVAASGQPGSIRLTWRLYPPAIIGGYNIYRAQQSGAYSTTVYSQVGRLAVFTDTDVTPGQPVLLRSAQPRHGEQPTSALDRGQRRTAARPELDFNRDGHADADADPYIHADTNRDGHADADATATSTPTPTPTVKPGDVLNYKLYLPIVSESSEPGARPTIWQAIVSFLTRGNLMGVALK